MNLEIIARQPKEDAQKPPLLFVHGAWHGAWCWDEYFLPYFAEQGYAAYAPSLRGHGKSEAPARFQWTRISDYVADVAAVVDQLPAPPVMIGHSMGGLVTQKYLEDHHLPAAVLLAPVPVGGVLGTALRILRRHPLVFLKANLTLDLYPVVGSPTLTREAFFSADIDPDVLSAYFKHMQTESYRAFLDMMLFQRPKPRNVSTDLLILGAEKDTIFLEPELQATADAYGVQPEFFSGMAHDMMLEPGWQGVADRIIEWLDGKGL